jgi:hypothetical protein
VIIRLDGIQTNGGFPVVYLEAFIDSVLIVSIWPSLQNGKLCHIPVPLNKVLKIELTVDSKRHEHDVENELLIVVNTRPHSCWMCGGTATDTHPCTCYGLRGSPSSPERIMQNNRLNGEAGPEPVVPVPPHDDGVPAVTLSGESAESSDSASDDEDEVVEVFCE